MSYLPSLPNTQLPAVLKIEGSLFFSFLFYLFVCCACAMAGIKKSENNFEYWSLFSPLLRKGCFMFKEAFELLGILLSHLLQHCRSTRITDRDYHFWLYLDSSNMSSNPQACGQVPYPWAVSYPKVTTFRLGFLFVSCFVFWDRVLICSPDWPQTCCCSPSWL